MDAQSGVTSWTSLDGSISAQQTTAPRRPTRVAWGSNGDRLAVRFDGFDDHLTLPSGFDDFQAGLTAFVVGLPESLTVPHSRFFDLGNGPGLHNIVFGRWANTSGLRFESHGDNVAQAAYLSSPVVLSGAWQLLAVVYQPGGSLGFWRNGVPVSLEDDSPGPISNVVRTSNLVGRGNWSDNQAHFHGDMAELILYARALSDAERQAVEQDLLAFHGIQ